VPDELTGRKVKCPQCKGTLTVNVAVEPEPPSPKAEGRRSRTDTAFTRRDGARRALERDDDWDDEEDTPEAPSRFVGPGIRYEAPSSGSRVAAGLGLASLLLGVLSLPLAWLPQFGQLGLIISACGLFLAVVAVLIALVRRGSSLAFSIGGLAVCGVALGLAVAQTLGVRILVGGQEPVAVQLPIPIDLPGITPPVEIPAERPGASAAESIPVYDAGKGPITIGDVRIQVGWVVVNHVNYEEILEKARSQEKYLGIQVRIENGGMTRKIDYKGWASLVNVFGGATLTDNVGNSYNRKNFGLGTQIVGQVQEATSIYPGKSVEDLLVFETPLDNIQHLQLELPGSTVGVGGKIRIQIPKAMIRRIP
jgi:hypothetical protein